MWSEAFSHFLYLYSFLYQAFAPCSIPEQVPANTVDRRQYLGSWYFQAAVSRREADLQSFKTVDSIFFTLEETHNNTLLLTGRARLGENCIKQTWTYHLHPERADLEMQERPKWRNLLWSGEWAGCADCIIMQEIDPPPNTSDRDDSINRYMLYARQADVGPEAVATFLRNAACHKMLATIVPPQQREICT